LFDCNGGLYDNTIASFSQTVISGSLVNEPDKTKMAKEHSSFNGWYTLDGNKWNFSDNTVIKNLTLRAGWKWDSSDRIENRGSITVFMSAYSFLRVVVPAAY